ncbi:hypothetical protein FRC01_003836 [Tulasnella sp. 417]|nr:hypothetical protein FRC01_003836 [Tulasnella sp. 417]
MQPQDNDDSSIQRYQTPPNQPSLPTQPLHEAYVLSWIIYAICSLTLIGSPQLLSTPRESSTTSSTANVSAHHSEILKQMKDEMVRCDAWSEGFDLYLPAVGIVGEDVDTAVEELKKKHRLRDIDNGNQGLQFTDFEASPSHIETTPEETRYEPLVEICNVLGELQLQNGRKATCKLVQEPDSLSSAETEGANFIVDAHLKLQKSTMPPLNTLSTETRIFDMAVLSECKIWERGFLDNRKNLLGATTFCMNTDPRRMHIYGITIEDSNMTIWYFSRSHSAKSPSFDFTKDPHRYIRIMLSFLFATEEELGYDPTIQRRLDSDLASGKQTLCYVYKVEDNVGDKCERYFKTQGAIFEHHSLRATGRATRVWKVAEVGSFNELEPLDGSILVLKDVWLDSQSKTEGQNLDAIFEELQNLADLLDKGDKKSDIFDGFDEESEKALKECLKERSWGRYFLSKVCHWQGSESKKVPPAAQLDSTLFDDPTSTPIPSYSDWSRLMNPWSAGMVPVARNRPLSHYCPKRQYRVVFKEICEALHDVGRLEDVVTALLDSVFENGNDGAQVRGVLADLEFARHFDPEGAEGSSDPKAGTAFFMAVEIQKQVPIYYPIPSMPSLDEEEPWSNLPTFTGVIHNFEHDMESIFWLFLWTLLVRFPPKRSAEQEKEFTGILSAIFQDISRCPIDRERLFVRSGDLGAFLTRWLNPELQHISGPLLRLRRALIVGYYKREYNFGNRASYPWLYPFLLEALESVAKANKSPPLTASSQVDRPAHVMIKRKHSSTHVGMGDDNRHASKGARVESRTDAASSRTLHHQNPEVEENEESGEPAKDH